jgi:hypothetical protein
MGPPGWRPPFLLQTKRKEGRLNGPFSPGAVLSTAVELADAVTRLECSRKAYFLLAGLDEDLPHDLPRLVDDLDIGLNEGDGCILRKDAGSRRDAVESKLFTRKEELGGLVGRGEESMLMKELALKYGATV